MKAIKAAFMATTFVAVTSALALSYDTHHKSSMAQLACECPPGLTYDASLPSSHPKNQCAQKVHQPQANWMAWFKGSSRSVSFHFLDLLELMSRQQDKTPQKESSPTPKRRA